MDTGEGWTTFHSASGGLRLRHHLFSLQAPSLSKRLFRGAMGRRSIRRHSAPPRQANAYRLADGESPFVVAHPSDRIRSSLEIDAPLGRDPAGSLLHRVRTR